MKELNPIGASVPLINMMMTEFYCVIEFALRMKVLIILNNTSQSCKTLISHTVLYLVVQNTSTCFKLWRSSFGGQIQEWFNHSTNLG